MSDGLYRLLNRLETEHCVPCSSISNRNARTLQPLLDSGALLRRRRGRGMVIEVKDAIALHTFQQQRFPHGDSLPVTDESGPLLPRSVAVGLHRDAKRARTTTGEPVLIRAIADSSASAGDDVVNLRELTALTGSACLVIGDESGWQLEGRIAVVENLEVFLHFEKLPLDVQVAIYAGGRLSGRVLDWLASPPMSLCTYLHCGDYDPVGLDEYLRFRTRLADRVALYTPDNLPALFARYGKRDLLRDSEAILARLRHTTNDDARAIVNLMDESGCGLEQEALLLPV
jgi:hypothetical protein